MNQPKVSVIIPVYNAEPYLRQCLDSVVNQTLKDIEIICVDDGSTDGSAELLRRLGESEPRLRLLQQENQGAGVARNRALAAARGEYIAFLDADDMLTPDALEAYYSTGIRTGADVLVAKGAVFSDDPRNAKERDFFLREEFIPLADTFSAKDCYPFVFSFTFGGQGGKCFRRSFIEENDLRFLTLPKSEDFYFIHRGIAKASCIAPIRRTLYLNRSVVTSLENQKDKMPLVFWEAVEMLEEKLKEDGLLEAVRQSFVNENVNRFAYNLRTMKTAEGFAAVLEKLRQVGETELGLASNPPKYYYLPNNYRYLRQLLGLDPAKHHSEDVTPESSPKELQNGETENHALICADPADAIAPEGFDSVVPVVFATNEKYAPYLGVTLQSILDHAAPGRFYRVYVLHSALTDNTIRLLEAQATRQLSVQCLNVDELVTRKETELHISAHLSKETYYRLVIPEVLGFYSHVIYLDCDLVVMRDIADIVPDNLGDCLLAAVRNNCTEKTAKRLRDSFGLDAAQYFNAGVLVMNLARWKAEHIEEKCFSFIRETPPLELVQHDQDVLNAVCRDRVYYLDAAWNFCWHMVYGNADFVALCKPIADRVSENFYILHFASDKKPWDLPELPLSRYFWRFARRSDFYEIILKNMAVSAALAAQKSNAVRDAEASNASAPYSSARKPGRGGKLRGLIQCYRDNGLGYTIRRCLYHLGLWEDEENPGHK